MGGPATRDVDTVAKYLVTEAIAEYKSEFYNGKTLPLTSHTLDQNRITGDCLHALANKIDGNVHEVFGGGLKIKINDPPTYFYPEISISNGKPTLDDEGNSYTNPKVIFEVLAESTESFDRGKKFHRYKQISTFVEYVLIAQSEPQIDVFYKREDGLWTLHSFAGLDAVMTLQSLNIQIKLADIYRRVKFEEDASAG